jgi:hypothetical protein
MMFQLVLVTGVCAEIPKGATIQEVTAVSNVPIGTDVVWRDGAGYYGTTTRLQDGSPVKAGDIAVDADYQYTLTFWNAGALGGTQYQKAVLTRKWVARGPGELVITMQQDLDEKYQKYLATNPKVVVPPPQATPGQLEYKPNLGGKPVFDPEILSDNLIFTGGPDGTFEGTTASGAKITFWLIDEGKSVTHGPGMDSGVMELQKNPAFVWAGWVEMEDYGKDTGSRFSGMTGQVEILLPGAGPDDWKLAKLDSALPVGTHIRTQEDSSAILSFGDMSTFVLKPESEVIIDSPPGPESKLKLVAGNIWANLKKIAENRNGSYEIEMNQAVCGIKGTTFAGEVKKDGTSTLKVIEGSVEFTSKADGKKVTVEGGSMVSADQKGLGTPAKFDVAAETASWDAIKAQISSGSPAGSPAATPVQTQKSPSSLLVLFGAIAIVFGLAGRNWR